MATTEGPVAQHLQLLRRASKALDPGVAVLKLKQVFTGDTEGITKGIVKWAAVLEPGGKDIGPSTALRKWALMLLNGHTEASAQL